MGEQRVPYLLDFFPLQDKMHTRIHTYFDNLARGWLTTTRCSRCRAVHWQPRVVCPECNSDELEWVDLPEAGSLYAFTEVHLGAPYGMEAQLPYVVGLVDLEGSGVRILGRIAAPASDLRIGSRLKVVVDKLPDGRHWFHFGTDLSQ